MGCDRSDLNGDEIEVRRVYIAGSVRETERVMVTLSQAGIEYFTAIEPFMPTGGLKLIFGSWPYFGIAFYVSAKQVVQSCNTLLASRLRHGLVPDPLQ
jgi:hypothetical protein